MKKVILELPDDTNVISVTIFEEVSSRATGVSVNATDLNKWNHISYNGRIWKESWRPIHDDY